MKKILILTISASLLFSSCGTILGGGITDCQKKQRKGEAKKEIRPGLLIIDICFGVIPALIDVATGAIYQKAATSCK